jgi:hypothetical protein
MGIVSFPPFIVWFAVCAQSFQFCLYVHNILDFSLDISKEINMKSIWKRIFKICRLLMKRAYKDTDLNQGQTYPKLETILTYKTLTLDIVLPDHAPSSIRRLFM